MLMFFLNIFVEYQQGFTVILSSYYYIDKHLDFRFTLHQKTILIY